MAQPAPVKRKLQSCEKGQARQPAGVNACKQLQLLKAACQDGHCFARLGLRSWG